MLCLPTAIVKFNKWWSSAESRGEFLTELFKLSPSIEQLFQGFSKLVKPVPARISVFNVYIEAIANIFCR